MGRELLPLLLEVEARGAEVAMATMAQREEGGSREGIFQSMTAAEYTKVDDGGLGDNIFAKCFTGSDTAGGSGHFFSAEGGGITTGSLIVGLSTLSIVSSSSSVPSSSSSSVLDIP